jgi:hypothetical protein
MRSFVTFTLHQRRVVHVALMRKMRNAYKTSVGKPGRERHFQRLVHIFEDNLDWILGKYGGGGEMWTGCIWFRTVMNFWVP